MISLWNNKLNLEKVFREHIWGNSCFLYKVNFKYTCIMATTNFKGQPVKLYFVTRKNNKNEINDDTKNRKNLKYILLRT